MNGRQQFQLQVKQMALNKFRDYRRNTRLKALNERESVGGNVTRTLDPRRPFVAKSTKSPKGTFSGRTHYARSMMSGALGSAVDFTSQGSSVGGNVNAEIKQQTTLLVELKNVITQMNDTLTEIKTNIGTIG